MKEGYIIGLDIGSNSVGWATVWCIKEKESGQWCPVDLIDLNSYIFQEVVEAKTQVPLNAVRRQKRLARRQTKRRARRRRELTALLRQYGLIPESENDSPYISEEQANSIDKNFAQRLFRDTNATNQEEQKKEQKKHQNPFAIRAIGMEQQLEPYELGRAILHLQSHRGYRSNEGAKYVELLEKLELGESLEDQDDANESADDKKEKRKVLGGISELEKEMAKADVETVGQYIWHRVQNGEELNRITGYSVKITETKDGKNVEHDVALYARRDMTKKEFNMLWDRQKQVVQETLDTNDIEESVDDVHDEIEKLLFEQFPVQSPPPAKYRQPHLSYNAVGKCTLEPKKNRCRAAWPEAQEFRTRQVINNLKKDREYLSNEQKEKLFSAANDITNLNNDGRLSWTKVAQCLGCQKKDLNYHDDGDSKSGLVGNRTRKKIHSVIGDKDYKKYIEDMLTMVNKRALYDRLVKLGLSEGKEGEALKLTMLELESSYIKYSLKAIRRLLPHMRDGKNLYEAMEACGYEDKDDANVRTPDNKLTLNSAVPQIANPRVQKAVYATRRVVNAIIKKYGKRPVQINIEMARDMKANKADRKAITKQNKYNRIANTKAEQALEAENIIPNRNNIKKYKCWHDEQHCQCAYCYKTMGFNEVFSGRTEWEHILPQSEFKQNYMNRVVACWNCNRRKGERTPYEAWGNSERWSSIENKMEEWKTSMPKQKRKRILNKDSIGSSEDFCERALKDTQYITTVVADYFRNKEKIKVQASRGMATSELRYRLGLDYMLPNPDLDMEESEEGQVKEKSRIDHRHHAIDAFVVAITSHKILMALTEYMKYKRDNQKGDSENIQRQQIIQLIKRLVPATWRGGNIHNAVRRKILYKNVAIQKKTKVQDALHEETIYGRSHYTITEQVPEKIGKPFIRRIGKMLEHKPDSNGMITTDGDIEWIGNLELYKKVKSWYEENKDKTKNITSLDIHQLPISHRCYTIRVKLEDAIKCVKTEEWKPGKNPGSKRWIADQELHKILYQWKERNNLLEGDKKAIAEALKNNPPRMPTRRGKPGVLIKRPRIAMNLSNYSVRHIPQRGIVQLGNNHHMDIFFNATEGTRKIRIASAMDVALRQSRKQPVIDKTPDPDWGDGWEYQTTLHKGDLVRFDTSDPLVDDSTKSKIREQELVYRANMYRVQTMSIDEDGALDVRFRLTSIAAVDNDHGLMRIRTANKMAVKRIELGVLGS